MKIVVAMTIANEYNESESPFLSPLLRSHPSLLDVDSIICAIGAT